MRAQEVAGEVADGPSGLDDQGLHRALQRQRLGPRLLHHQRRRQRRGHSRGPGSLPIDLKELVDDLRSRGLNLPLLIRFSDILKTRVEQLFGAFQQAIAEYGYKGSYRGVYPIKVNQQRHVVEEIVEYGRPFDLGLEAGTKPELLVALALLDTPRR